MHSWSCTMRGRRETVAFNGSGVAAAGATRRLLPSRGHKTMPLKGVHAVSVPGGVSVYEALWKRYCTMDWAELWEPAFAWPRKASRSPTTSAAASPIEPRRSRAIRFGRAISAEWPRARARRALVGAEPARKLRAVAKGGAELFIAAKSPRSCSHSSSRRAPLFDADDFAQQQAVLYAAHLDQYRGLTVYETAPPSQGFLVLEQLNIIEGFDIGSLGPLSAERIHLLVEAKKLASPIATDTPAIRRTCSWPLESSFRRNTPRAVAPKSIRSARGGPKRRRWLNTAATPATSPSPTETATRSRSYTACRMLSAPRVVAGETGVTLNNRAGRGFSLDPDSSERDRAGPPHHAHAECLHGESRRPAVARRRHARRRPADAVEHRR